MISDQKQLQCLKLGFSFIEVIITITIIGIVTAVTIPNYNFYLEKNNQLLIEQEAIILQEEIFERMVYLSTATSVKLPYVSNSNHGGIGVLDITDTTLLNILNTLVENSSILNYKNKSSIKKTNTLELSYGGWEVECTITYKTGEIIKLYFEVRDDKYLYHDTASVTKFIYINKENVSVEKTLLL